MVRRRDRARGFTLVEVIVVLVILAILAAIAIPALTGYITTAQERACQVNISGLRRELMAEEIYQTGGQGKLTSPELQQIADVSDFVCAQGGPYKVSRSAGGDVRIQCAVHNISSFGFDMAGALSGLFENGDSELQTVLKNFTAMNKHIDSSSPNGTNVKKVVAALKKQGFDMEGEGVNTWSYQGQGSGRYILYWTTENIADYQVGQSMRVMRYNSNLGTYSAGYVTVGTETLEGQSYKVLSYNTGWQEYTATPQTDSDKKNFDTISGVFEKMPDAP